MVKAPRSKGCRVCVDRRIGCDLTRPSCIRCQKAKRQCPGYDDVKFVDEGPSIKGLYNITIDEAKQYRDSSSDGETKSKSPTKRKPNAPSEQRDLTPLNDNNRYSSRFERVDRVAFMCPAAYDEPLLSSFIASVRTPLKVPTYRCHGTWLSEVAQRSKRSPCLIWAIRAVAVSHLGRAAGDETFILTSRQLYGKALLKVNDALQDKDEGLSSDTLSATMLLSFYEIFNCTDSFSWVKHAGGAGHLIRLRGPDRHRTGFGRSVFLAYRYFLVMEAFQRRIPCFLAQPEWQALSWHIHHTSTDPLSCSLEHEEFYQEFVSLPTFICDAVHLVSAYNAKPTDLHLAIHKGQQHRLRFRTLHELLTTEFTRLGVSPQVVPTNNPTSPFQKIYRFNDIQVASIHVGFWGTCCILNVSLMGLEAKLANLHPTTPAYPTPLDALDETISYTSPTGILTHRPRQPRPLWDAAAKLSSHPYRVESQAFAREVCKCGEWLSSTPFLGPLFLVLSLRLCLRVLPTQEERLWVIELLEEIGRKMGIARASVEEFQVSLSAEYGRGSWIEMASVAELEMGQNRERVIV